MSNYWHPAIQGPPGDRILSQGQDKETVSWPPSPRTKETSDEGPAEAWSCGAMWKQATLSRFFVQNSQQRKPHLRLIITSALARRHKVFIY